MTDLTEARQREAAIYRELHAGHHDYGVGNNFRPAAAHVHGLLTRPDTITVLDVGCGSGRFLHWAAARPGISILGTDLVDTAPQGLPGTAMFMQAPAHRLPGLPGEVDLLTSWDVLEHCLPDEIPTIFAEWHRLAPHRICLSIHHASSHRLVAGVMTELHRCQQPPEWWHQQFIRHLPGYQIARITQLDRPNPNTTYWQLTRQIWPPE